MLFMYVDKQSSAYGPQGIQRLQDYFKKNNSYICKHSQSGKK